MRFYTARATYDSETDSTIWWNLVYNITRASQAETVMTIGAILSPPSIPDPIVASLDVKSYNAYQKALAARSNNVPLTEMTTEQGGKYFLRSAGIDASEDARVWINNIVPVLADETRYTHIWYRPDTCEMYYFDVVRGGWFKKVWRRIKGFCKKAWKALPKVIGVAKKVANVVAPILPPPYGTVVSGVTAATSAVSNALNLVGNVSQKATGLALMDTASDKFIVVPQYRVSSNRDDYIMPNVPGNEYVPNTMYNGEWISADPIEVPVEGTTAIMKSTAFRLADHPNYENIRKYVAAATEAGDANPLWFQQRLKVLFTKVNVPN